MCMAFSSQSFYTKYVKLPSTLDPPPQYLQRSQKLWPFFEKCLGAIDGSHIAASPSARDRANTRDRKGSLSQNVLAICSFSMRFLYLLTGWEGSVNDSFLYSDARINDLRVPPGYFYLGDAGFPLCDCVLIPYRGVRYHLQEWGRARQQ
jgi:hypothetical protein